jgi:hypothetical protein
VVDLAEVVDLVISVFGELQGLVYVIQFPVLLLVESQSVYQLGDLLVLGCHQVAVGPVHALHPECQFPHLQLSLMPLLLQHEAPALILTYTALNSSSILVFCSMVVFRVALILTISSPRSSYLRSSASF